MSNAIETTEAAEVEAARRVNEEVASKVAAAFDDSADILKRGKLLHGGVKRGATLAEVANLVTVKRYAATVGVTETAAAEALGTPEGVKRARKLRVSMSKADAQAYVSAYDTVLDAGIMPDRETYAAAFRAKSTGGTAALLKAAVEAANDAEKGERSDTFVAAIRGGLANLTAGKGKGRPAAAKVPATVEAAIEAIDAILAHEWEEEERAAILAHLAAVSAPVEA